MSVKKEVFGIHPSGKEVYKFEIVNKQGMKAVITNFGAILISLFVILKTKYHNPFRIQKGLSKVQLNYESF